MRRFRDQARPPAGIGNPPRKLTCRDGPVAIRGYGYPPIDVWIQWLDDALYIRVVQHADDSHGFARTLFNSQCCSKNFSCRRVMRNIQQPFDAVLLDTLTAAHEVDIGQYRCDQFLVGRLVEARGIKQGEHGGGVAHLECAAQTGLWH